MSDISIRGAKENNLKNIDLDIPRNKVVCFVGVSGSGKSTIAFDIIAREGERQYFESLNAYARRYLHKSNRPNVDSLQGISSTIVINQDRVHGNPRSTVGTLTEAYTYLRLLYARVGLPTMDSSHFSFNHPDGACPRCKGLGRAVEPDPQKLIDYDKSLNEGALLHSNWRVGGRMWHIIKATHYFDMDKQLKDFSDDDMQTLLYAPRKLFADSQDYGANRWTFQGMIGRIIDRNSSTHRDSPEIDLTYFTVMDCPECHGGRLNQKALSVLIDGKNIGEVADMPLTECLEFVKNVRHPHAEVIKPKLVEQLESLINVGVGYLSLNRSSDTLSGGEAQRVKFARQLGCDLIETIYVFDEPTAGLHPRDIQTVVDNLIKLRDKGNSVLVVEHDEMVIRSADHIVEIGPGGGAQGGETIAQGTFEEVCANPDSVTGPYLKVASKIEAAARTLGNPITILDAHRHNLKHLTVDVPTKVLVCLTGVSGSGKSSLVEELVEQQREKMVVISQDQIGGNKRGCIGTYCGVFDYIRKVFAKEHQLSESLFSFNAQGACSECQGLGFISMDMNFLGDVRIHCDSCNGNRYKEKVMRYLYKGKNIAEVLKMTVEEVKLFFSNDQEIASRLDLLISVGLDYIALGQTLDTLSGGESQRLKLASRLQTKGGFYILDEPTTGLHFADVEKLMRLLHRLVDNGNTVLLIEHNMDVIRQADWIIDLGPDGGDKGGEVVAQGTPQEIMKVSASYTGRYLRYTKG